MSVSGGFIHSEKGPIQTSLAQLMKKPELNRGEENTFLYFDYHTLMGLLHTWVQTRAERGLPANLSLEEATYFTLPKIARINKLLSVLELANKENFAFTLVKTD